MSVALVHVFNGIKTFYPDIHNTLVNDKINNVIKWNDTVIYYASVDSIRFTSDIAILNMESVPNKKFTVEIDLNPNNDNIDYPYCYSLDLNTELWVEMKDVFRFIVYDTLRSKDVLEELK